MSRDVLDDLLGKYRKDGTQPPPPTDERLVEALQLSALIQAHQFLEGKASETALKQITDRIGPLTARVCRSVKT